MNFRMLLLSAVALISASASARIVQVSSEAALNKILAENDFVIVDFFATWCGPCKQLSKTLHAINSQYPDIVIVKIDTDQAQSLSEKYGVKGLPTVLFFKKGKRVTRFSGAKSRDNIRNLIEQYFSEMFEKPELEVEEEISGQIAVAA